LDIELTGFTSFHEEDLRIGAGATLERTAVLKLAGVAESIVVQGAGSRIEARGSGFETRFGPEYLDKIPTRRFSMFDSIRAAPGVSPTSPASSTVNTVSVLGSGGNENLFLIDGTNFTCPCAGISRAEPGVDFIQEVQIQSAGASAEYGNFQGAVFNVVTGQGRDRFQYDASYYGQASGVTRQPVLLPIAAGQRQTGYERRQYRGLTTNLGDVRVSRFVYTRHDDAGAGDLTAPSHFDRVTGVNSGAPRQIGVATLMRTTAKATLSHYQRGLLGADHDWKIGTQFEKGGHHTSVVVPTGVRYVDNNGRPFQAISSDPALTAGEFITAAAFASDSVTIGDRLTINAGVRFDRNRAISQDVVAVDSAGRETGAIVPGLGDLYAWNLVSPRLGITAK